MKILELFLYDYDTILENVKIYNRNKKDTNYFNGADLKEIFKLTSRNYNV